MAIKEKEEMREAEDFLVYDLSPKLSTSIFCMLLFVAYY